MKKEQLALGNQLSEQIERKGKELKSLLRVLKEVELESYKPTSLHLSLSRTECYVNTERTIKFLRAEVKVLESEILDLEKQFEEL